MKQIAHLIVALVIFSVQATGQEKDSYDYEVKIGHDNDFLVVFTSTDRYYTYGINAAFRWRGKRKAFLFKQSKSYRAHFNEVELNVEAYTPDYLSDGSIDANEERPYAGWSYVNLSQAIAFEKSFLRLGVDFGVLGPDSKAGKIQNWFHREISGDVELNGWNQQLENQFGINLNANYGFSISNTKIFELYSTIDISVGNIYTYARPMAHFRLGKFEPIQYSIGQDNQLLGKRKQFEFYFDTGFGAKGSLYNATLQGDIFDNKDLFDNSDINNLLFNGYFGICFLKNGFSVEFKYHMTTGEFYSTEAGRYATLEFAHRF